MNEKSIIAKSSFLANYKKNLDFNSKYKAGLFSRALLYSEIQTVIQNQLNILFPGQKITPEEYILQLTNPDNKTIINLKINNPQLKIFLLTEFEILNENILKKLKESLLTEVNDITIKIS